MSVRTTLILCFAAITIVLATPTLLATTGLVRLRAFAVEGRAGQATAVASLGAMQAGLAQFDRLERSYIATLDPDLGRSAAQQLGSIDDAHARFDESGYGALGKSLREVVGRIGVVAREADARIQTESVDEATAMLPSLISLLGEAEAQFSIIAHSIDSLAQRDVREAEVRSASARRQTIAALLVALLLTLAVALLATHAITGPLRRLNRATSRVADGSFELPSDLPYHRHDEIGELSTAFGVMVRKLADLDRTKARFFGVVSHELKTPLNVIRAYAELLGEERSTRASPSSKRLIADVVEQSEVMARRVSRLMDLSRLETGAYRLSLEATPLDDLATGLRRTFASVAEEGGVRLAVHVGATAQPVAVLDVDIVRDEIVGNLLVNAFRFAPEGSTVEVRIDSDEAHVVLEVTDRGPGIPEEMRPHIFSKHYMETRSRAVGSGLGLAIAKEMVELHGGVIALEETAPPLGARFKVVLPIAPEGAAVAGPEPACAGTLGVAIWGD
jgi:signal transduction histidine kinase